MLWFSGHLLNVLHQAHDIALLSTLPAIWKCLAFIFWPSSLEDTADYVLERAGLQIWDFWKSQVPSSCVMVFRASPPCFASSTWHSFLVHSSSYLELPCIYFLAKLPRRYGILCPREGWPTDLRFLKITSAQQLCYGFQGITSIFCIKHMT